MFLEDILLLIVFLIITLPIGIWPIFIGIDLHTNCKNTEDIHDTDCINCLYGTSTGEWCRFNCKGMNKFVDKRLLNEKE